VCEKFLYYILNLKFQIGGGGEEGRERNDEKLFQTSSRNLPIGSSWTWLLDLGYIYILRGKKEV
jgi:hypothetical protein